MAPIPKETRAWILTNKPTDMPVLSGANATWTEKTIPLPELTSDKVLIELQSLSNDPAQRGWISANIPADRLYVPPVALNTTMHSRGVCKVVASNSDKYKEGDTVCASIGWAQYAVLSAGDLQPAPQLPGGLNSTHYLGALGLTGLTAYFGLVKEVGTTGADSVLVSGAAGATGSMVVQIAKHILGCPRVIGIAGSDDKCKWVEGLGADKCLNYKAPDFKQQLIKATDGFVDVFYDNVGGEILDLALTRIKRHGRIAACGAISGYNNESNPRGIQNWFEVIANRITIKGFIVLDHMKEYPAAIEELKKGVAQGKLKIGAESETVVKAKFDEIPATWMKLFEGSNQGKLITTLV